MFFIALNFFVEHNPTVNSPDFSTLDYQKLVMVNIGLSKVDQPSTTLDINIWTVNF